MTAINDSNLTPFQYLFDEDTLLNFTTLTINGTSNITVALTATNGILNLGSITNLSSVNGNGTNTITFSGLETDINNALATIIYDSELNYNGSGNFLNISVNDGISTTSQDVSFTINPINDAPVLTSSGILNSVALEDTLPVGAVGSLISDFIGNISDDDSGAVKGIAITNTSSEGILFYSLDDGTTWLTATGINDSNALLLGDTARIYVVNNTVNFNGTLTDVITFRAWDQTTGTNGNTADTTINGSATAFSTNTDTIDVTVNPVNDAPTLTNTNPISLAGVVEDTNEENIQGDTVANLFASKFVDSIDGNIFAGIAIVDNEEDSINGKWQWLDNGVWTDIDSDTTSATALLLDASTYIRFNPFSNFNGVPGALTVILVENSQPLSWGIIVDLSGVGATGETTPYSTNSITLTTPVTAVNDAPTRLDDAPVVLVSVSEDTANLTGETVLNLFSTKFNDTIDDQRFTNGSPANTLAGVAIVNNTSVASQGNWQWFDGTAWVDIDTNLSNANALVLAEGILVRFLPAANFNGTPGDLTARLIENSAGAVTSGTFLNFDISNGGIATGDTTSYSDPDNTVVLNTQITAVNDAPTRNSTKPDLLIFTSEDSNLPSAEYSVEELFGSGFQDTADAQLTSDGSSVANEFVGVAIALNEAVAGAVWQWLNGSTWENIPTNLSDTNALVLSKDTRIRFFIDNTPNFAGDIGKLTARLIDDSAGNVTNGSLVDVNSSNVYSNSANAVRLFGNVTPNNDVPTLNPLPLQVNEGGTTPFFNVGNFNLIDVDNQDVQLIIKIQSLPTHGYLTLNGIKVVVNSTFSADQIANLQYQHNGDQLLSDLTDGFDISVDDGAGGSIAIATIPITVKPVNQLPTTTGITNLYEGQTGVVVPITISDPDQGSDPYTIKILSLPINGILNFNGTAITQTDINNGLSFSSATGVLTYDHDGNDGVPPDESFNIEVTDNGGGTGIPEKIQSTVNLNIIPNNDDPILSNNTGGTLNSNTSRELIVTNGMLQVTDPDSSVAQLTYTLTDIPTHGFLLYNDGGIWKRMLSGASFTQADINSNKIQYRFFESATGIFNDDFKFKVQDSEVTSWPVQREGGIWKTDGSALDTLTFALIINADVPRGGGSGENGTDGNPIPTRGDDVPPSVVIVPATVNEEATLTFNTTVLNAIDPDTDPSKIFFRVSDIPQWGTLKLNGSNLKVDDSFTQEDITNGSLTYEHGGNEKFTDRFGFTLSDGSNVVTNTNSSSFFLDIDVTPQNDTSNLDVTSNKPFLSEAGTTNITNAHLTLSDVDGTGDKSGTGYATPNTLTFQVQDLPDFGYLEVDQGSGYVRITELNKGTITITKAQLDGNKLRYVHDGTEHFTDSFKVEANDNTTGTTNNLSAIETVNIDIAPLNDDPVLQEKKDLTVLEGGSGLIFGSNGISGDASRLIYSDTDNITVQRQYLVTDNVKYGTLFLTKNGVTVALGANSVFSQDDLDNNRITYKHDSSENHSDYFEFAVRDGGGNDVPGRYDITITPLNDAPTVIVPGTKELISTAPLAMSGIVVDDVDLLNLTTLVESDRVRVTLDPQLVAGTTYTDGTLNLITTAGITFINPSTGLAYSGANNNNTAGNKLVIEGTLANVNAALASLTYQAGNDLNGTISLDVTVDDRLRDGSGVVVGANGGTLNQDSLALNDLNNTVKKTILINVSSVNDAPLIITANTATLNEDRTVFFNGTTGNVGKIILSDRDAFNTNTNTVTLTVTKGLINLADPTLITGGLNNSNTITLTGTLAAINKALLGLSYTPIADYNNFRGSGVITPTDSLTIVANDGGNTGTDGPQETTRVVSLVVRAVNDAPTRTDAIPVTVTVAEDSSAVGDTVFSLFNPKFLDTLDNQTINNGSPANTLAGVILVANTANASQGKWQWFRTSTNAWVDINTNISTTSGLRLDQSTKIRFLPAANFQGIPTGSLTARLVDTSAGIIGSAGSGGTINVTTSGGITRYSNTSNAVIVQASVTSVNDAPTVTSGTVSIATIAEDTTTPSGTQLLGLLNSNYSDLTDDQTGKSGGNTTTPLSYVAIVGSTDYVAGQGTWQYSDGSGNWINIPVSGLSNTTSLIIPSDREIRFLSAGNFFGNPGTLTVKLADNSSVLTASTNSSDFKNLTLTANGGIGTTGSWSVNNVTIATNVTNVNDAPTIINPTTPVTLTAVNEDTTEPSGATVTALFGSKYQDTIDNQQAITGGGNAVTPFAGIAITGNASTASEGTWEYNTGGGWLTLPSNLSDTSALVLATTAQLRFVPAPNYYGDPGQLTVRVSDGAGFVNSGTVQDINSNIAGTGGWSNNTTTLITTINSVNDAPVLIGTPDTIPTTTEDAITPADVGLNLTGITDIEIGLTQLPNLVTATVTIGDFFAGDQLGFTLPSGVTATANGTGNIYTLSGSSATLANILSALQSTTYKSVSNNPTNIVGVTPLNPTRTIQYQINDTQGINNLSNVISTTVTFTEVSNDSPRLTNASFNIDEDPTTNNGQTIDTLFAGKFSDDDGANAFLSGLAIIGNTANATTEGTWEYSTNGGTNWFAVGTVNDSVDALALSANTFIRFVPVQDYNGTPTALQVRALDNTYNDGFTSIDGSNNEVRVTVDTTNRGEKTAIAADPTNLSVTVDPINDTPAISGTTGTRVYIENTSAIVLVTGSRSVVDVDANNFPNGNITLGLTSYQTGDVLSVNNQGTSANQIGLSGSNVTYGGVIIGTINSTNNGVGKNLVINFNSQATKTAVQALLDNLTYSSTSDDPTLAGTQNQRTFNVTLNDGNNGGGGVAFDSNTLTGSIDITAVNDAPVNTVPATQTTLEDSTRIFNTANGNLISISDIDAGNKLVTVTLTATNGLITLSQTTDLTFGTGNGTLNATMTVTGTITNINNALNGLSFAPTANYNNNFNTSSITIVTDDLGNTDAIANQNQTDSDTIIINITPVNDAPIVSLIASPVTGTYTEGATAFNVRQNIASIADIEIDNNEPNVDNNFTATATITDFFTGDVLGFTVGSTGVTVNNQGNGVYTLTGGSKADVLQVLQSTTYSSTSPNPSNYNTNLDRVIAYQINDNQVPNNLSNIVNTTVNIAPVNNAPTVTATSGVTTFTEGNNVTSTPVVIDSGLTLDDVDNEKLASATVSITGNLQNTEDILAFTNDNATLYGNITASYVNGVLTFNSTGQTATLAQWQNALRTVTYTNSSQIPNNGDAEGTLRARTISISINDGTDTSNVTTKTVQVVPVNDTPILGAGSTVNYLENATATAIAPTMTLTNADTDLLGYNNGSSLTIAYTSGATSADQLSIANGNGITVSGNVVSYNGNAIGTFSGGTNGTGLAITFNGVDSTAIAVKQLLNNISFNNTSEDPVSGNRVFNITINDNEGGVQTATSSTTVNVIPVNDAPTLTSTGLNPNYVEDTVAFSSIFNGSATSTIEAGQLINQLVFTVSNIQNGTSERISLNSSNRALATSATNVNISNGFTANISYNATTKVSTVTINNATGATPAQIDALVNSLGYKNTSQAPTEGNRTITLTSLKDNRGIANSGVDTSILNIPSTVTVIAVNDAPLLNTAINPVLASTEDNPVPVGVVGSLISTFVGGISDVDGASVPNGIAITNVTNQGTLYYSIDNGNTWIAITSGLFSESNALLLANNSNTRIYFQPTPNFNGNLTNSITFRAWDQTSDQGSNGGFFNIQTNSRTEDGITSTGNGGITGFSTNTDTISININAVNDAPIATGSSVLTAVNEDSTTPLGATVTILFSANFSDSTDQVTGGSSANTLAGIAIVGNAANATTQGNWQYFNGTAWTNVGTPSESSALTVTAANSLRFLPNTDYHGAIPALTVRLIDSSTTVTTGNTVNLTTIGTGGTTAYSLATVDLTTSITTVNDAPIATGTVTINSANEDTSPNGTVINTLITSSNYNDTKDNQTSNGGNNTETSLSNIAIVGSNNYVAGQGTWQYANGSGGWINIPVSGLSDTQALIIPAGRDIRFIPATDFFGTPGTLNVRLADSSSSPTVSNASGDTKDLSANGGIGGTGSWSSGTVTIDTNGITNVNDAPTIDNAATPSTLANIDEDETNSSGNTITNLFAAKYNDSIDNQTGVTGGGDGRTPLAGIAITGNAADTFTQGKWQYNTGSGWVDVPTSGLGDSSALVLPATAKLAFLPNSNFNGTPGQLTVRLSDGTAFDDSTDNADLKNISSILGGVNGWSTNNTNLTTSINAVNDAPIASASSLPIEEDTANPSGSTVSDLFTLSFNDSTDQVTGGSSANSLAGVAILGNVGNPITEGTWQYFNGTSWVDVGSRSASNALIVSSTDSLRFVPVANYNGAGATLTVNLIDNSSGTVTTGNTVNLSGVNATGGTTVYSGDSVILTSQVTEGNDPPTLVVPNTQTISSGTTITFSQGNGNAITFDDFADLSNNGVDNFTVTLNVTTGVNPYGTLALSSTTGLSVSGNNSATVTLTGTKDDINNALNGLVYTPANSNVDLSINLNVSVNDLGNGSPMVGDNPFITTNNVTINISSINEAPILTNPSTIIATEDTSFSFTGSNLISFNDPDDFGSSSEVTLSVANGTLTLSTLTGLIFTTGDGTNDQTLTFRGNETALNAALASLSYQGNLNYNNVGTSKDILNITINDLGNTGTINGVLGASNIVNRSVDISVTPVNDAPIATGNSSISPVNQNNTNPSGVFLSSLLQPNYSDVKDDQSIAIGSDKDTPLRGVAIVGNGATSAEGKWQYGITNGNLLLWYDIPTASFDTSALILNNSTQIRFLPNSNFNGTPGNLNIRLSDGESFPSTGSVYGSWNQNISTILGGSNGWSSDFIPLSTTVNPINTPPVINNLDGDIFKVAPNGSTKIDQDILTNITDTQGLKNRGKLTISLDGLGVSANGDKLTIASSFLSGIGTIDSINNGENGKPLTITFNKDLNSTEWNALIQNITYTANDTLGLRTASFTVTDGESGTSNTAIAILNVSSSNIIYNLPQEGDLNGVIKSDILQGTSTNDILKGKGNHDNLYGRDGNDLLIGGNENDRLDGGNGDDILFGGSGVDVLLGMAGNDYLNSGLDFDTLTGGVGADQFDYSYGKNSFLGTVSTKREYDIVTDFNVSQGDKILTANNINSFNITPSTIPSLTSAGVQGVLGNGSTIAGSSPFLADSAALVKFGSKTFLAINDNEVGFDANKDVFIEFRSSGILSTDIFSSF